MALHAAEEESIEAIKTWWRDNGNMIMSVLIAAAVIWGGWSFWQNSRSGGINAASDMYEEVLELATSQPQQEIAMQDRARILQIADTLKTEYSNSVYALYAALFAAQQAVTENDLGRASDELRWVLANVRTGFFNATDDALVQTATLRLGRVLLAQGDTDEALELVEGIDPGTYEADFAELRGDIYVAQDRPVDARDAYTTAQQVGSTSTFLQMKLDELGDES